MEVIFTGNGGNDQMSETKDPLPEFSKPPVSEVALSVEFEPLPNWRSPHAGLYWGLINSQYPNTEVQPPLPSQIEKFDEQTVQVPTVRVELLNPDISRFWFLADPANWLIQVQRDRFVMNWRKVSGEEIYPRYEAELRPRFQRELAQFKQFVEKHHIGQMVVRQCEITYVNDIARGEGWDVFSNSLALFAPLWSCGSDGFLPLPETLTVSGSFRMPEERGRLHFSTQHLRRQIDQREVVQLRLTGRGQPDSPDELGVLRWMDFGREWVVRGFADLTSRKAHELWKRTR